MTLRLAEKAELSAVCLLYEAAKNEELCSWNEFYPTLEDAKNDFENNCLYILSDSQNILGALSVVPENEMDHFDCWTETPNPREISRVVISREFRGRGLAALMVGEIMKILSKRGESAIRLSVTEGNAPAFKTYEKCGFEHRGETDMYGGHYYLMEKLL